MPPRHRSTDDPFDHRGSVTISVTELGAAEWRAEATCRRGPRYPNVSQVYLQDVHAKIGDRWVYFFLRLSPGATSVQAGELTIGTSSPTERSDYDASPGDGLKATLISADGLTGSVQFSAALMPNPARSTMPEFDRLTGTFQWACESTPSG